MTLVQEVICIVDQVAHYVTFKEHSIKSGKQEPKAGGGLIFDEVKVALPIAMEFQK